jgi:hypothetical protein
MPSRSARKKEYKRQEAELAAKRELAVRQAAEKKAATVAYLERLLGLEKITVQDCMYTSGPISTQITEFNKMLDTMKKEYYDVINFVISVLEAEQIRVSQLIKAEQKRISQAIEENKIFQTDKPRYSSDIFIAKINRYEDKELVDVPKKYVIMQKKKIQEREKLAENERQRQIKEVAKYMEKMQQECDEEVSGYTCDIDEDISDGFQKIAMRHALH